MLVGILRCGSGITGSGGVADVAPFVSGVCFCPSDALICVMSRLRGAGFGTGTVCARDSVAAPATDMTTVKAKLARVPASTNDSAARNFQSLVNAQS
jgi:hypothetical protein